jgi:hypothetical protein
MQHFLPLQTGRYRGRKRAANSQVTKSQDKKLFTRVLVNNLAAYHFIFALNHF